MGGGASLVLTWGCAQQHGQGPWACLLLCWWTLGSTRSSTLSSKHFLWKLKQDLSPTNSKQYQWSCSQRPFVHSFTAVIFPTAPSIPTFPGLSVSPGPLVSPGSLVSPGPLVSSSFSSSSQCKTRDYSEPTRSAWALSVLRSFAQHWKFARNTFR